MSGFFQNVETKAYAAVAGGGGGAVIGGFLDWLLAVTVWGVPFDAAHAQAAAAAVPAPVLGLVTIILAALGAFAGAWLAPHTVRSDVHVPQHAAPKESGKSGPAAYNPDYALAPDKD